MDGPGLQQGFTKTPNVFTIHSVDENGKPATQGGDDFQVKIDGPVSPDVSVSFTERDAQLLFS
jgi:hypothetical protein